MVPCVASLCPHQTAGWRTGRKQSLSSPAPKSECFLHTRLVRFFFQPRCLPAHLEPVIMGWGHDFATQGESSAWSRCDLTWPPFSPSSHTRAPKPPPSAPLSTILWFCFGCLLTSRKVWFPLLPLHLLRWRDFREKGQVPSVCCHVLSKGLSSLPASDFPSPTSSLLTQNVQAPGPFEVLR